LFYDGGNTNYYDARPWRTAYGCSLSYRMGRRTFVDLFLQHVVNKPDFFKLSEASLFFRHTFKNMHRIDLLGQYFHYHSHYPNNAMFLVNYTIPFNQIVGKRNDCGDIEGCIYDIWRDCPIPHATVHCDDAHSASDASGFFSFSGIPRGPHCLQTEILPKNLITPDNTNQMVEVMGGKKQRVIIPVVPACALEGEIVLYAYEDSLENWENQMDGNAEIVLVKRGGLSGVRIVIDRDNGSEIYTCLSGVNGQFSFPKLRPGTWHIEIMKSSLPMHCELSMNDLVFELSPGKTQKVIFNIKPKPIKMTRMQ